MKSHNKKYVKESYQKAAVLWKELKAMRNNPDFHDYGYSLVSNSGKWNARRKNLKEEWSAYIMTLSIRLRFEYDLTTALLNMKYIGRDWYRNKGKNTKKDTEELIKEVEHILSRDKG